MVIFLWRSKAGRSDPEAALPLEMAGRSALLLVWLRRLAKFGFLAAIVLMVVAFAITGRGGGHDYLFFFGAITLIGISLGSFVLWMLLRFWFSRGRQ